MDPSLKRVKIITLGCRANQSESDAILSALKEKGFESAEGNARCDICIINTCAVTRKAARQSRQTVRKYVRLNPDAKIIVTGCHAQNAPEKIAGINGVDCVVGQSDKHLLPDIVANPFETRKIIIHNIWKRERFPAINAVPMGTRARQSLKIQDGCDQFCTYCIVPFTRGPSLSLDPEHVISFVRTLCENGTKEVVLTGIHLGAYGHDLTPKTCLVSLLKQILDQTSIERIRLSSIEPVEVDDDLIRLVASSDRLCHHFHLPLQSGDDSVLKRMHRPYSAKDFSETVFHIRKCIPDAAIGADVLVGFPGEDDTAFKNTYDLIASLPITYLHVFPFSPRPPAPAASYPEKIRPEIVKKRCEELKKLGTAKKTEFYKAMVGKTVNVLIEGRHDKFQGFLSGKTKNYVPVRLMGGYNLINKQVLCRITGAEDHESVSGEII